ncbi:MAG: hypothetical protein QOF31_4260 [Mycobacterium sp.]|nr:hypothetical protein [Mycobacterium sp.]
MADLSVPFRSLRDMAERRFRRTQEWPQIADESVWQTVDAALISDTQTNMPHATFCGLDWLFTRTRREKKLAASSRQRSHRGYKPL